MGNEKGTRKGNYVTHILKTVPLDLHGSRELCAAKGRLEQQSKNAITTMCFMSSRVVLVIKGYGVCCPISARVVKVK